MHIGILTFHNTANYGAVLQAYALKSVIDGMGHYAQVVDYRCPYLEGKKYADSRNSRNALRKLRTFAEIPMKRAKDKVCRSFAEEHLDLTRSVSRDSLQIISSEFDAFVTGSDQVWNMELSDYDTSYYLDFLKDDTRKVSYAASFGVTDLNERAALLAIENISRFDFVSVRESSAVDLCQKLGVKRDVKRVLDPTLLANRPTIEGIVSPGNKMPGKFALIYALRETPALFKSAREYANRHKIDLVCVISMLRAVDGVRQLRHPSFEDFLWLFQNAEHVFTNSFHGMCISIQFEKQFTYELYKGSGRSSRLSDLSAALQLESREVSKNMEFDESPINYNNVNKMLQLLRAESLAFLKEALE